VASGDTLNLTKGYGSSTIQSRNRFGGCGVDLSSFLTLPPLSNSRRREMPERVLQFSRQLRCSKCGAPGCRLGFVKTVRGYGARISTMRCLDCGEEFQVSHAKVTKRMKAPQPSLPGLTSQPTG
jgi:hypothetical protein